MKSIKIGTLVGALAALAVWVAPASAGAATLTNGEGSPVPVGTIVHAVSSNTEFQTETIGRKSCTTLPLLIEVTQNSGGVVEGTVGGLTRGVDCTMNGKNSFNLYNLEVANFRLESSSTGSTYWQWMEDLPGGITLPYEGTLDLAYKAGTCWITISTEGGIESAFGTEAMNGEFSLSSSDGQSLFLH